ncbi:MAG: DUF423 domain-containing protein [Bradymonadaceae bacterium]
MKLFAIAGAVLGALAVAAGAFGAHGLESRLEPDALETWNTAARYQMYHALALLAAGTRGGEWVGAALSTAGWAWIGGTVVFSGSLYLLVWTDTDWLGAITPIGGLALIVGWVAMAIAVAQV